MSRGRRDGEEPAGECAKLQFGVVTLRTERIASGRDASCQQADTV